MKSRSCAALMALAGLALAVSATAAMATNNPIRGVDIIVKKNPGGIAFVVATSDASGRFSGRLAAPGRYTVSTACRKPPCAPYTVQISASGAKLKPGSDRTYDLTVEGRAQFVLSGTIQGLPSNGGRAGGVQGVWKAPAGKAGTGASKARGSNGGVTHEDTWDANR